MRARNKKKNVYFLPVNPSLKIFHFVPFCRLSRVNSLTGRYVLRTRAKNRGGTIESWRGGEATFHEIPTCILPVPFLARIRERYTASALLWDART